jgi:hypothetical protein
MGSRIITLQRQARELGRLRTGYTDTSGSKPRPVRSQTWIITSHAEHYVQAAAEQWGGTPEKWQPLGNGAAQWRVITETPTLDAILPPGDPLSQSFELWSRGGCQRRCDGMTEQLSDQPCMCRAEFGDAFHEVAPRDAACKMTTRLNVMLPDLPDIGAWRVETHSYYSANEMAAAVDMLKGGIGEAALIPVKLRIEQRTAVREGKTKHFPVVAVELRGGTAGQVLAGAAPTVAVQGAQAPAVEGGKPAIEAPSRSAEEFIQAAADCTSLDDLTNGLREAKAAGFAKDNDEVWQAFVAARQRLTQPAQDTTPAAPEPAEDPRKQHILAAFRAQTMDDLSAALSAAQAAGLCKDLSDESDEVTAAFLARRRALDTPAEPDQSGDRDALWAQIVAAWPGDRTSEIEDALSSAHDVTPATATADQLARFLADIKAGTTAPAQTDSGVPF